MKEQIAVLPELPIVGTLMLKSQDGKSLCSIDVVRKCAARGMTPFFQQCHLELFNFLSGKTQEINISLDFSHLSPFHLKVLKEMKKIPYGQVASYKDLAVGMKSKGYQAIGTACGRNPFLLIYPCHRVIGSKDLGGFAHGLKMKKELLKLEGLNSPL